MIEATINIGQGDTERLNRAMDEAAHRLGKDLEQVQGQAAWYIARSMGAATKRSAKLRPIVKNPDPRAGKDSRVALFGVWKYRPDGTKRFVPIGRTGEYGKIRFTSKTTGEVLSRDRITGKVTRITVDLEGTDIGTVKDSPHRKIGRSGMAKRSWARMQRIALRGGTVREPNVGNIASVSVKHTLRPSITIINRLRYIEQALANGPATTDGVVARAAANMMGAIESRAAKLERHWGN